MKIIITSILILGVILVWWFKRDSQEDPAIASPIELNDEVSYFEENLKCGELKDKISSDIEKVNGENWHEKLQEVFFSPQHDSCLYISEVQFVEGDWSTTKRLMRANATADSDSLASCEIINYARYNQVLEESKTSYTKSLLEGMREQAELRSCEKIFDDLVLRLRN